MSSLLLSLKGHRLFNKTLLPPELHVYDDLLEYRKRYILFLKEMTISYNQITQVTLNKGLFFSSLEIVTNGTDNIEIYYLQKKQAARAKKIIDQKIYTSHAKHHDEASTIRASETKVEKSLSRLKELLVQGSISEREYKKRKESILNKF